ncbi:hypothetical protein BDQ12DRAFT_677921, partial [Crucibulum laeve]
MGYEKNTNQLLIPSVFHFSCYNLGLDAMLTTRLLVTYPLALGCILPLLYPSACLYSFVSTPLHTTLPPLSSLLDYVESIHATI